MSKTTSVGLQNELSSKPLHNSVKWFFLNRELVALGEAHALAIADAHYITSCVPLSSAE
jgi:hypothetical protein